MSSNCTLPTIKPVFTEEDKQRAWQFLGLVREGDLVRFVLKLHRPHYLRAGEDCYEVSVNKERALRRLMSVTGNFVYTVSDSCIEENSCFCVSPLDVSSIKEIDWMGSIRVPLHSIAKYQILSNIYPLPQMGIQGYFNGIYPHRPGPHPNRAYRIIREITD